MEKWKEVFVGKIPREPYQMQLINGEKQGLTIELIGSHASVMIKFGVAAAVRMLDEGIIQAKLYNDDEIAKYKTDNFQNCIYEVQDGEFGKFINQISNGYGNLLNLRHYIVITQNYVVDIVTEWEPIIEILQM